MRNDNAEQFVKQTLTPDGQGHRIFYFDCLVRTRYTGILSFSVSSFAQSEARAWRAAELKYARRGWKLANPELRSSMPATAGMVRTIRAMARGATTFEAAIPVARQEVARRLAA